MGIGLPIIRNGHFSVRTAHSRAQYNSESLLPHRPPFDATNQLALAKKINAGRFAPISSRYTEGLFQAIRWQLHRQRSRRPRIEDLERIPELQQRLRAYAAANPAVFQSFSSSSTPLTSTPSTPAANLPDVKQLQATYNTKMKELLGVEENLRRQEAELNAREKKLKGIVFLVADVIGCVLTELCRSRSRVFET